MTHAILTAIALNAEGPDAPEWVQLTPAGPQLTGRDGRRWTLADPEAVVLAFNCHGADLPIDIEHATQIKGPKGEAAPAVGWIKEVANRSGALWGRVEWTAEGAAQVAGRAYRYLSPAFNFAKATGAVTDLVSAGLTNKPNFHLAALNAEGAPAEVHMDKELLEALGLADGATTADAVAAIATLKADTQTALNRAGTPDPALFVPKADFDLATNRIAALEAGNKARVEAEIIAEVDAAITAGKVAPSSRDYHLATCRAEGGLELFRAMVAAAPVLTAPSGLGGKAPGQRAGAYTEEELAICRQMGMDPKDVYGAKE